MMGVLHQRQGKGYAAARTLGETMSASRVAKQPEDSAAIEQIHDISRRPQFSGLSGELGVASSQFPIQAKLTIGEPGDKYEQEADRVASQVVQQINAPASVHSSQGQSVQRTEAPEEEEIQAKPENTSLQRMEVIAIGEASTDLDKDINSARGSGKALAAGLQQSMGQAMGADFSGVKVHTDTMAEKLNRSIQARAFTTGQDVFFRQGVYDPGSKGGQELIAHELTHVVQQNGGAVQRAQLPPQQKQHNPATETASKGEGEGAQNLTKDVARNSLGTTEAQRPNREPLEINNRKEVRSTANEIIQRVVNIDLEGTPASTSIVYIKAITRPTTPATDKIWGENAKKPAARHIIPQALIEREFKARYSGKTVTQLQAIFPSVVIGPNYLLDMAAAMQRAYTEENTYLNRGASSANPPEGATASGLRKALIDPKGKVGVRGIAPSIDQSHNYKNFWEGSQQDNLVKDLTSSALLHLVQAKSDSHFGTSDHTVKLGHAGWKQYQKNNTDAIINALAEEFDPPPFTTKSVIKAAAMEWARLTNNWIAADQVSRSYYDIGRQYVWVDAVDSGDNESVYKNAPK